MIVGCRVLVVVVGDCGSCSSSDGGDRQDVPGSQPGGGWERVVNEAHCKWLQVDQMLYERVVSWKG